MDNFNTAASIVIDSIVIESHNEKTIEITDLFNSLTIYENMFSPLMKAAMVITDATGITADLPIVGQEKVTITISRGDEYYTYVFRTTHLEKMSQVNDFTVNYVINLVDESYYMNGINLVSQSFSGSMSEIVGTIYTDFLKTELEVDESFGNYKVVIPRWNPYKAIGWCTRRARTENNSPFVNFSTLNGGHQFRSIATLFEQEPIEQYFRTKHHDSVTSAVEQRGETLDFNEYMQTPISFFALETGPTLEQLHKGAYASRTLLVDTAEKVYQEYTFNYDNEFDNIPHLAAEPMISDTFMLDNRSVFENSNTVQRAFAHSSHAFTSAYSYNSDVFNTSPYRGSYLETLNNYRYRLGVNGRFDLAVGQCVDLQIMKNRIFTVADPDDAIDSRRSGKHIITALKHMFTRRQDRVEYLINFDCNRDTMGTPYDA